MKKLLGLIALLMLSVALIGCRNEDHPLVGRWENEVGWITQYNADGTGTWGAAPVDSWKVKGTVLRVIISGVGSTVTWNVSGNQLTLGDPSSGPLATTIKTLSPLTKLTENQGGNGNGEFPPALIAKWYATQEIADSEEGTLKTLQVLYEFTSDGKLGIATAGFAGGLVYTANETTITVRTTIGDSIPLGIASYVISGTRLTISNVGSSGLYGR